MWNTIINLALIVIGIICLYTAYTILTTKEEEIIEEEPEEEDEEDE